ncbi:ABC-type transport auxiliary lipoprotein family protein [Halomonas kalidii]|uniref:ABC-type transport auxiliary lipoprotein family protein n=1 Tax=Halomonas kalidii TaxID=3043293 RepID=A0ABT6VN76_9GAMM|nr:ABC-type transport auxiliary lipoprotein family protein [Halomonas kalidii]MDI5935443.1 ABC-type transport auxiliary lipoprotein family protein [Halomonas kalidii]
MSSRKRPDGRLRLPLLLLLALLAGCAVPGSRDTVTPLRLETPAAPEARPQRFAVLSVETPRVTAGISDTALLYIEQDFRRRPYVRSRWGAPLSRQLGDLLADHLSRSGMVAVVQRGEAAAVRLEVEVLEWLHDYRGESPEAVVALRTTLRGERGMIDQWRWSERRAFRPEGAAPGLAAQQALLEAWLEALLERLDTLADEAR